MYYCDLCECQWPAVDANGNAQEPPHRVDTGEHVGYFCGVCSMEVEENEPH